jgi:hypothetical protein
MKEASLENIESEESGGQCAKCDTGLNRVDLSRLKGSDPRKVALAELLWKQTTVSQEWLAERLKMRSAANVSQLLRRVKGHHGKVPGRLGSFVAGAMRGSG